MIKDDVLHLLDELFELDEGTITGSETLRDIPEWSSLTFIGLISMADEQFNVLLSPEAVLGCETVNDLAALINTERSRQPEAA